MMEEETTCPTEKWAKYVKKLQRANKQKKVFDFILYKRMQIKTTRYHLPLIRLAKIKV